MRIKNNKHLLSTLILVGAPLTIFLWLKTSGNFDVFYSWSQHNLHLFAIVLTLLKVASVVYPPLPGGILTLGAIPVIGVFNAYVIDFFGSLFGSVIAYFLGLKYGYGFLEKIFDVETIEKFKKIKIKPGRELESVFVLRILGAVVVEIVAYGSGLLKIRFSSFVVGSALSHLVIGIPIYYLAQNIFSTQNIVISLLTLVGSLYLLWKLKGRYFE